MSEKEICAAGREGLIDHTDPNHQEFLEERKSTGKARGELLYRRKDGSRFIGDATSVILDGDTSAFVIVRDITQEKKAEKALRESEERLKMAMNMASLAQWEYDFESRMFTFDDQFYALYGTTAEHEGGNLMSAEDYVRKFIPPEESAMVAQCIADAHTFTCFHREHRIIRADGVERCIAVCGEIIRDEAGRIVKGRGTNQDITERKRMEQERRESGENFSIIFQATPDLIAITRAGDGTILEVNEAFSRLLGFSRAEAVGKSTHELSIWADPADRARWMAALEATGQVDEFETTLRCRDGSLITCVSTARPLDFGGEKCVLSVVRDITERKRAEQEEICRINAYNRSLIEASLDPLVTIGPNGFITDANAATEEVTGRRREELIGSDFSDFFTDPDSARSGYQKVFRDGLVRDYPLEIRHRDGHTTPVLYNASVYRDAGGDIIGVFAAARDITEQKRADESRKKLETQLQHAQKMESIGVLAGGVAHDFNNLLTAISGYGQILRESIPADDELSQENIRNVLKAADRAAELTRGLLAFSRKQTINPKPVHIDSLIGNAGKLIQRIIGEDIEFGTNFPDKNLLVMADAGQIEQVLMNLATNARDAMPDGGHLCITTRRVVVEKGSEKLYDLPSPGKYALISVSDTGTGIEKEFLGKIFEPFYTTKGVGEGTGLGLSMVHGIIKQHNGSVLVSSEPGKGTQIDTYLPLIEGHAEEEKSKPAAPHAAGMETLLVVEDEEIVRNFMQNILEKAGYRVIVAGNGEDAVERFRENDDISLVLSDVIMPRKNGCEMLDDIRRMKTGIKAVFISGYSADYMQDKGILDDVTGLISKPFRTNDLLQKVREVLDKDC